MLLLKKLDFKITDKKILVFLGIANAAGYLLQYVGMPYTTAAKAALFINLSAMWVALLSPKLLGESFSRKKIGGVLFGLIGIVFVSTNLDFSTLGQGQLVGDMLLITSGIRVGAIHDLQQEIGYEFNVGNVSIHDLGTHLYIAVNCAIHCFVWTRLF